MKLLMTDRPVSAALPQDAAAVDLSALRIANCVGCFGCWTKTPGRCVIRDDAARVYPLIARSEQVLYVSRVKYGSYAPVMKTMLERAIPVQQAFLRIHNGETHHVHRKRQPPRPPLQFQALRRAVPGPLEGGGPLCGPDCKESRRAGGGCGGLHRPAAGLPPLCRRPSRPSPALSGVPGGGRAGAQAAYQRADQLRLSGATPERCRGGHGAPLLPGERLSLRRMPQNRRRGGHPGHPLRLPGQAEHQGAGQGRRRRTVRRAGGHHAPVPPLLCAGLHTLLDADGRRQRLYAGTDGVHGH